MGEVGSKSRGGGITVIKASGVGKPEESDSWRLVDKGANLSAPNKGHGKLEMRGEDKKSTPQGPHGE